MSPRLLALLCGGLVLLRAALPAHAPALVDAHAALVACALLALVPVTHVSARVAGLVLLAPVLSLVGSWDPWVSLLALPLVVGSLAFFLLAAGATARARVGLLGALATAGALNALIGAYQRTVLYPRTLAEAERLGLSIPEIARLASARPLGMSLSPDLAGAISLAGLFAAVALVLEPPGPRWRAPAIAAASASLVGVLLSRSAGTALALVVGLVVATLMHGDRRRLLVGLFGAAVPLGVVIAVRGVSAIELSVAERLANYRAALSIVADAPVFGVGYARFAPAYALFREAGSNITRYAHGSWAQGLAETGVVGVLCVGVALGFLLRAIAAGDRSPGRAVIIGGLAAATARAAFDYDLQIGQTAAITGVLAGLALPPPVEGAGVSRAQRGGVLAFALAMLALVVVLGIRDGALHADPPNPNAVAALAQQFPYDVEAQLAQARAELDGLATCAEPRCAALAAAARGRLDALCARSAPPSAAFLLRARLRSQTDDLPGALSDVDAALLRDPGHDLAHRMGLSLADQLDLDPAPRLVAAARWGITVAAD